MKIFLSTIGLMSLNFISAQCAIVGENKIMIDHEQTYSIAQESSNSPKTYEWKIDSRYFDLLSSPYHSSITLKASISGSTQMTLHIKQNGHTQTCTFPIQITDESLASEIYDDGQTHQKLKSHTKLTTVLQPCDIPYLFLLSTDITQPCLNFSSSASDEKAQFPHQWTAVFSNNSALQFNSHDIEIDNHPENPIKSLVLKITGQHCEKQITKNFRFPKQQKLLP